jgi:hypothetical protein
MSGYIPRSIFHALEMVSHSSNEEVQRLVPSHLRKEAAELVRITNSWSKQSAVQGFGVSKKRVDNKWTNIISLVIYVRKKVVYVPKKIRIPSEILIGKDSIVVTDVVEVGKIELCNLNQERHRPVFYGCSIGHSNKTTGTIGAVFNANNEKMILSCGHVVAPEGAQIGDTIQQPGFLDSNELLSTNEVAALSFYSELMPGLGYSNSADVGIARETGFDALTQDENDVRDYTFARKGLQVHFTGRSTEDSLGEVIDVHYRNRFNIRGQFIGFGGQILTTCPSSKGDSGALLRTSSNRPVGLLLGGSIKGSVFSPMNQVLRQIRAANF